RTAAATGLIALLWTRWAGMMSRASVSRGDSFSRYSPRYGKACRPCTAAPPRKNRHYGWSDVERLDKPRPFLNARHAQFRLTAHQALHEAAGLVRTGTVRTILQGHPKQGAPCRVHGRFPQLTGRHFAQALEAADIDLAAAIEAGLQQLLAMGIVAGV